jgi:hypothetical protein
MRIITMKGFTAGILDADGVYGPPRWADAQRETHAGAELRQREYEGPSDEHASERPKDEPCGLTQVDVALHVARLSDPSRRMLVKEAPEYADEEKYAHDLPHRHRPCGEIAAEFACRRPVEEVVA